MRSDQIVTGVNLRGRRAIFLSDVHGELPVLQQLLRQIDFRPGNDLLFVLGDLIEKGSRSLDTLRFLMRLSRIPGVTVLKGNNDDVLKLLQPECSAANRLGYLRSRRSILSEMAEECGINLDEKTEPDTLRKQLFARYEAELSFLQQRPLIVSGEGFAAAHPSLQDAVHLENNDPDRVLRDNDFLFQSEPRFAVPVIVGHYPTICMSRQIGYCGVLRWPERNLFAIDGGCGMHAHGQLNALIVEDGDFAHFRQKSADLLPSCRIVADQMATPPSERVFVRYFESEIEVLQQDGEFLQVRHQATGKKLTIPCDALRYIDGQTHCFNSTSFWLPLRKGEQVKVIREYTDRCFCKKDNVLGWASRRCLAF